MERDEERDWSQLPPELLEKIAGTVTEISDHIRLGAVCTSWRSSSRAISPPPQSPWLLLQSPLDGPDELHFLNPTENWKCYTVHNPDAHRLNYFNTYGSANGYLLSCEYSCYFTTFVSIVNPLIPGSWHSLPPLPVCECAYEEYEVEYEADERSPIDAKLLKSDDVTLVLCSDECNNNYLSWRPGDQSWGNLYGNLEVYDFAYHKGSIFVVESSGETVVLDASTLAITCRVPQPPCVPDVKYIFYLVESSSKELLMVAYSPFSPTENMCEIFQLEYKDQAKWLKITSIGDDILFMDNYKVLCSHASMCDGLIGNCIYYTGFRTFYRIDIGDNNVELLPYNLANQRVTWMVPCISSSGL